MRRHADEDTSMKRLPRIFLNAITALSLLLCLASAAVWLRSSNQAILRGWCTPQTATWLFATKGRFGIARAGAEGTHTNFAPYMDEDGQPFDSSKHPQGVYHFYAMFESWRHETLRLVPPQGAFVRTSHWRGFSIGQADVRASDFSIGPVAYFNSARYWRRMTITMIEFPAWSACLLFAALPALRLLLLLKRARPAIGFCPICGYDLRATPTLCPECGATPKPTPTTDH
jgi:hypothetical protein